MSKKELDNMFIKETPIEYFIDWKFDHYEFFNNRVIWHLLDVNSYESHVDFSSEIIKKYEKTFNKTEQLDTIYSHLSETNSTLEECSNSLKCISKMYIDLYSKYNKVSERCDYLEFKFKELNELS